MLPHAEAPPLAPSSSVWSGLWGANPALVQLLGLCPLFAVTTSVVNGLALGLATAAILMNRRFLHRERLGLLERN